MKKVELGTVIKGTLRSEDLIPAFADLLYSLEPEDGMTYGETYGELIDEARRLDYDDPEQAETVQSVIEDLVDALNEYAPPFCYFGAHSGDGSDIGFWISHDQINDAIADDELVSLNDPSQLADTWHDMAIIVNDHGNMTLMRRTGWEEVWSVV